MSTVIPSGARNLPPSQSVRGRDAKRAGDALPFLRKRKGEYKGG